MGPWQNLHSLWDYAIYQRAFKDPNMQESATEYRSGFKGPYRSRPAHEFDRQFVILGNSRVDARQNRYRCLDVGKLPNRKDCRVRCCPSRSLLSSRREIIPATRTITSRHEC